MSDLFQTTNNKVPVNARYQNFIVFDPASQRVKEHDILYRGEEIVDIYYQAIEKLEEQQDLPNMILKNRLTKIGRMLDLVTDFSNIVMTKYFDRIWRRYSYLSNLGETFLDLETYFKLFPSAKSQINNLKASRLDEEDSSLEVDPINTEEKADISQEKSPESVPA